MSVEPRLAGTLPARSGLTEDLAEQHFDASVDGTSISTLIAVIMLRPKGIGQVETADGQKRHVRYEVVRLEIPHGQAAEAARECLLAGEAHRVGGSVLPLDFSSPTDERKAVLYETLLEWAERGELDLVEQWWGRHDPQHVPAPKDASYDQLVAFAIDMRVLEPEPVPANLDGAGRPLFTEPGAGDEDGAVEPAPAQKAAAQRKRPARKAAPKPADVDEPPLDDQ